MASSSSIPCGSSPRVRGLLVRQLLAHIELRIIPARAGFTGGAGWCARCHAGSSPRVRGLPHRGQPPCQEERIIPARAGFTPANAATLAVATDHPRACGVYDRNPRKSTQNHGSSPRVRGLQPPREYLSLAGGSSPRVRGLPHHEAKRQDDVRIIPARAGFTRVSGDDPGQAQDHPRACGVYRTAIREELRREGSSPRVRGLRRCERL